VSVIERTSSYRFRDGYWEASWSDKDATVRMFHRGSEHPAVVMNVDGLLSLRDAINQLMEESDLVGPDERPAG
jgi:hypothetical protein